LEVSRLKQNNTQNFLQNEVENKDYAMHDTPTEAFIHLLQNSLKTCGNGHRRMSESIAQDLRIFSRERLLPLLEREKRTMKPKFTLSLVGLTNVGKSTLMEALFGHPIAPRKNGPATAIPVEYGYSDTWSLSIRHHAARKPMQRSEYKNSTDLGCAIEREVVDIDPTRVADIAWTTACGPIEMLRNGLVMADTPGFGAAQPGNPEGSHQKTLEDFVIQRVDRIYFCVAAGETWAISEIEKNFYKKFSPLCGHVVVTRWEGTVEDEDKYQTHYREIFPGSEFVFTNAKRAMKNHSLLDNLRKIITDYSTPENRRRQCFQELCSAWHDIVDHVRTVHEETDIPWRPDALMQFTESCRNHSDLDSVVQDASEIIRRLSR
jgi:hypothetical protein